VQWSRWQVVTPVVLPTRTYLEYGPRKVSRTSPSSPPSHIQTATAQDFLRLTIDGVDSLESLIRDLPWRFSCLLTENSFRPQLFARWCAYTKARRSPKKIPAAS
jgi:hypothetical protein